MQEPGLLLLDKPVGIRSTYCVERVRKALGRNVKTGHGGTLDSTASGLLILLIAGATRLSDFVMQMTKTYHAVIRLGMETTTCDYAGEPLTFCDWQHLSEADLDHLIPAFLGWRMQIPPKISAVHVNGQRAHELARRGEDPDIKPRPVFIESMERLSEITAEGEVAYRIVCGKGTYVRSIARDLGQLLRCGAHIAALRRERIGPFDVEEGFCLGENTEADDVVLRSSLLSITRMNDFLPSYALSEDDSMRLSNGLSIPFAQMKRISFGHSAPTNVVFLHASSLHSIARLERTEEGMGDAFFVRPEVNIKV